jgi:C4-dicarboxylate transporter DctM subunit
MPVIILGGIYSGIFTPTESGAVACLYGLFVGLFVYRELKPNQIGRTLLDGVLATAPILLIIAMGGAFSRAVLVSGIPRDIATAVTDLGLPVWALLLLLNIVLLIVGMFIEENTAIIILVPLLMPLVLANGIDPIQFGVIMVLNLGMGLATPPFAPNLFVASTAIGVPFHQVVLPALRLLATAVLPVLVAVNVFPILSTWFL